LQKTFSYASQQEDRVLSLDVFEASNADVYVAGWESQPRGAGAVDLRLDLAQQAFPEDLGDLCFNEELDAVIGNDPVLHEPVGLAIHLFDKLDNVFLQLVLKQVMANLSEVWRLAQEVIVWVEVGGVHRLHLDPLLKVHLEAVHVGRVI